MIQMRQATQGVPLYFTTQATNVHGHKYSASCSLPTIDQTPPTGRFEPWHLLTSHPYELHGSLIIVDDSDLVTDQFACVGFGEAVDNTVDWHPFAFEDDPRNSDAEGALGHIAADRTGRLNVDPIMRTAVPLDADCAQKCIDYGNPCVSFDFDYASTQCNLHNVIEGIDAQLVLSDAFHNFERLGQGSSAYFSYHNLSLTHGNSYYLSSLVTNDKGYRTVISSDEIVVDFTPPIPGPLENVEEDVMRHDECSASVLHGERCEHVTPNPNHRFIIDGPGSKTVFNGNQIGFDLLYTLTNHYIAGKISRNIFVFKSKTGEII